MKKFLFLHTSSDLYGAGRIFLNTILILHRQGHKIVVSLTGAGPLADALEESGIIVKQIKLGILRRRYMNPIGLINRGWYTMLAIFKLSALIRRERVDIVFSNACGIYAGAIAARLTGRKHIFHVHEIIENPRWFASITGTFMKKTSDKVIVVSEAVRQAWQSTMPAYDIDLVYNGLDYSSFLTERSTLRAELGIGDEQVVVGMVARVHFWKGQGYFLQIAAALKQRSPNVKFVMVGDAFPGYEYLYDEIDALKKELGLEADVIDLGYRTDIPRILQTLDVFVLPSILPDPLPTVILEAMASGKPVVATAHGGALEMVVNGETGFHMPFDDPEAAAEILDTLVQDEVIRGKFGEAGRQRVQASFSLEQYERNMTEIVLNV